MRSLNLISLGTTGAGKSALTATFSKWIEENTDWKVAYINLDPGCDLFPSSWTSTFAITSPSPR